MSEIHTAKIALGSNLGDRHANIASALAMLVAFDGIRVSVTSTLIETPPVDCPDGSGVFLNGAAIIETTLAPQELMRVLLDVERQLGRDRSEGQNAPRTVDLDLLCYGDLVLEEEGLTLPHPRMHLRDFVLKPLAEIAPDFVHPVLGKSVVELLRELEKVE